MDAPDYYDGECAIRLLFASLLPPSVFIVISNPMDLQTMLKKVKAKQYKSKREFKDDLDLIWSNCFTYNATVRVSHRLPFSSTKFSFHRAFRALRLRQDHPLRHCAIRLKKKADGLLVNITDRKDRVDPNIPPDFSAYPPSRSAARPKINGYSSHDRIRPFSMSRSHSNASRSSMVNGIRPAPGTAIKKMNMNGTFGETPALVRTPEGMAAFRSLDMELDGLGGPGPSTLAHANGHSSQFLVDRLRSYIMAPEWESGSEDEQLSGGELESDAGLKRRLP